MIHYPICDICFVNVILIGYMGCGKTTIGKQLASAMNREFYDLDQLIEKQHGESISSIFEAKGAVHFRKIESEALNELVNNQTSSVIATGGGTPVYGDNMTLINDKNKNCSVYLKVSSEILYQRLWKQRKDRPLIPLINNQNNLHEFIRRHMFERALTYETAMIKIDVSRICPEEASKAIFEAYFKTISR